ncbi:hypothetical protein [Campylobacter concisus]|nr:hypothetical protein [Campylobacter concisus]
MANSTSKLANLRKLEAFYAVCIECFLTNFAGVTDVNLKLG